MVLCLGLATGASVEELAAQNSLKKDIAREDGIALVEKIKEGYPNVQGEVDAYFKKYPESPVADLVKLNYALYNFNSGNYAAAAEILESTNCKSFGKEQQLEYLFKKGYCQFRNGLHTRAKETLSQLKRGKYHLPALYYIGYINYLEQDFQGAIPYFERAMEERNFEAACKYHILESKFMLKDYDYITSYGPDIYNILTDEYRSQAAKILSESFFAKDKPLEARHYNELYSTSAAKISNKDNFYSGMIAYTLKSYKEAIGLFEQVASVTDSIGQSAYYHIGQCHFMLKNKLKAQEAFKMAAGSGFDAAIQEDASFNYAKLSFDLNRNIAPFNEYLTKYPASNQKWDEIHSYMAASFLLERKYEKAIGALKQIRTPGKDAVANLQKACFLRGIELAGSNSYTMASGYFKDAVHYGSHTGNSALSNLANFWLGECKYRTNDFAGALHIMERLANNQAFKSTAEYPAAIYSSGYCHFKMGNFPAAIESFARYLACASDGGNGSGAGNYIGEARLRLADSYFMNRNYEQAAQTYTQLAQLDSYKDLYAPLQGAVAYGLLSNEARKIELLEEITTPEHSSDKLYTQAIYELGRTYVQNGDDQKAAAVLDKLVVNPADSLFYHKALLEIGMINANRQRFDQALAYYKRIVEEGAVSEESQSALAGIENIYIQQNKQEKFLEYIDNIGLSTVKNASERETILFNSAEQVFLSEDYAAAVNSLLGFLEKYPDGAKTSHATFYLAECYNKLGKAESAANEYLKVMMRGQGDAFSEVATLSYAKLAYQLQKYEDAVMAYGTLEQIAKLGNNRTEAVYGKMKSHYQLQDYRSTLVACNQLLALNLTDKAVTREVSFIKAKCQMTLEEREQSVTLLADLAKDPSDQYGAEAAYMLILDAYDSGDFVKVEELTFALSDSGTPQTYWLAKSFITLGDSYAERDELEQARATFESICDNYSSSTKDDILSQVGMRLEKLASN